MLKVQISASGTGSFIIALTNITEDTWLAYKVLDISTKGIEQEDVKIPVIAPG